MYTHFTRYNFEEFYRPTGQTQHYYLKQLNIYSLTNSVLRYMSRKFISNGSQLSAITYVYTPTLRATNIEFSDVENS